MKLIDKDALVAEIERLSDADLSYLNNEQKSIYLNVIGLIKTAINSLEVKEVDLKQSYREYINNTYSEEFAKSILDDNIKGDLDSSDLFGIMSYGFELGLKAQKGE